MNKKYFQPEIETMSREKIRDLQNEKLLRQVRHVWENVPYYRAKMQEKDSPLTTYTHSMTSTSSRS
ncbi:MAG: hypothetical protein IJU26_06630 [Synergistaceae bacterium]|nr:hypothetical protein [Synergistaceae bacterium]